LARAGKYWQEPASIGKNRQVLASTGKKRPFDPGAPGLTTGNNGNREHGTGNPGTGSPEDGKIAILAAARRAGAPAGAFFAGFARASGRVNIVGRWVRPRLTGAG